MTTAQAIVSELKGRGFVLHPLKGKIPVMKKWQELTATPDDIEQHIEAGGNVGAVCGKASNITCIDLDSMLFADEIFSGKIETLCAERTQGRGHVYYRYNPHLPASKHHDLDIEILNDGNNIVLPGSKHPSGDVYHWKNPDAPILDMPAEVEANFLRLFKTEVELKKILAKCRHCFRDIIKRKPDMHGADGREYMLAVCTDLKANGAEEQHIKMFAKLMYREKYDEGRTMQEWHNIDPTKTWTCEILKTKLPAYIDLAECEKCEHRRQAFQNQPDLVSAPKIIDNADFTDVGNAKRLVATYGDRIRYCHPWKSWLCWNGKFWERDQTGQIFRYAKDTAKAMLAEAETMTGEMREKMRKRGILAKSLTKLKAMITLAESEDGVTVLPEHLDTDIWLLNVQNGTLNLKSGELQEHRREDFITKISPVVFDASAQCARWLSFLDRIFEEKKDLIDYVQKITGQCLTGDASEEQLYVFWGTGANGKCQPKGSKVLMSTGMWKNIEEIKIGDEVISPQINGSCIFAKIVATHSRFENDIYEVREKFRHKQLLYTCAGNHEIPIIRNHSKRLCSKRIANRRHKTRILDHYEARRLATLSNNKSQIVSFTTTAIEYKQQDSTINPYCLGIWLGDGHFSKKKMSRDLGITTADKNIIDYFDKIYPDNRIKEQRKEGNKATTYRISLNGIFAQELKRLGLEGKGSGKKFIPTECLLSSIDYRKDLLSGIIDTDGFVDKVGAVSVATKSIEFAKDIKNLVFSLGGFSSIRKIQKGIKKINFVGEYYDVSIQFKDATILPLKTWKANRLRIKHNEPRNIAIECIKTEPQMVYGIETDSPSKWYITDNWMVTHNSTLVETIGYILADYAKTIAIGSLLKKEHSSISNDIARLRGARFVYASEPEFGDHISEGKIKNLTGRDTIQARFLFQENFEFKPEYKIVISTNHKPIIKGMDQGIWRRIKLIPFAVTIPQLERDTALDAKLRVESAGILNWLLQGCLAWQRAGLNAPPEVIEATEDYQDEMDKIGDFFNHICIKKNDGVTPFNILYFVYKVFCKVTEILPVSEKTFSQICTERGFKRTRIYAKIQGENVRIRAIEGILLSHRTDEFMASVPSFYEAADGDVETIKRRLGQIITEILYPFYYESLRKTEEISVPSVLSMSAMRNSSNFISVPSVPSVLLNNLILIKLKEKYDKFNKPESILDLGRLQKNMELYILSEIEGSEQVDVMRIVNDYCSARGWQ